MFSPREAHPFRLQCKVDRSFHPGVVDQILDPPPLTAPEENGKVTFFC